MIRKRQPILSEISRRRKLGLVCEHLVPGSSILEVGTGSGWFAEKLRLAGYRVTTLDIVGPADIVGDITDWRQLRLAPASFDAVVALEVIEHVDCLSSLQNLCRENGLIILSSPHPRWDWLMKWLESLGLTQKRTSVHCNLTDFRVIAMPAKVLQRPLLIHQVAVFTNSRCPKEDLVRR